MEQKNMAEQADKERFDYFIEQAIQQNEIWLLQVQEGLYAMFEDENEQQYIPVWPGEEYAKTYATGDWEGYQSERMDLKEFTDWLQELAEDQIFIGVFPGNGLLAVPIKPIALKKQLKQARIEK